MFIHPWSRLSTMSDAGDTVKQIGTGLRLADVIRDVKNAAADRDDVVVELREASRMRLDLLAADLASVFSEVPDDIDLFDFTISSGLQPRLWIDAVSHVAMGTDRRTYRFLKDTRLGRVVLAESASIKPVAEQVARYVAERILERQRLMHGASEPAAAGLDRSPVKELPGAPKERRGRWETLRSVLALIGAGVLFGLSASAVFFWERFAAGLGLVP
jgi:hypothetical protein